MSWLDATLVALGAAVGASARHLTNQLLRERFSATTVGGTLVVNIIGSFILGLLAGPGIGGAWMAVIGIGFCGAFTTFSTLALEIWTAVDEGRRRQALANVALSLTLGLLAAYAGFLVSG